MAIEWGYILTDVNKSYGCVMTKENITANAYMSKNRWVLPLVIIAILVVIASVLVLSHPNPTISTTTSTTSSAPTTTINSTSTANGLLKGTISIGPLCPVERANGSPCGNNNSAIYTSRNVVLTAYSLPGAPYRNVTYTLAISANGTFGGYLKAGSYLLNVTNCTFSYLSCHESLPKTVYITPHATTIVNISIDTGIR